MANNALLLLDELRQRAGLEEIPLLPDRQIGIVFGDLPVSMQVSDGGVLHMLGSVEVPAQDAEAILPHALAESERLADGTSIGYDDASRSLIVSARLDTGGLHYSEFEQRLLTFVELCERLREPPAAAAPDQPQIPDGALFA